MARPKTAAELRQSFLQFFAERGHTVVPSSSLVPAEDPTLLFTNAGMVQFKDFFTGARPAPYPRAVSVQKCMRAGGKHNDLENVGETARHQTFFEMLGNFSFGDYFKREAIRYAWEYVTRHLEMDPGSIWVTVHKDDEEAARLWQEEAGLPRERIVFLGDDTNFWAMGDTGPCGPNSEIFIDRGEAFRCGPQCGIGLCDCDRWLEIWNLVFMQYERKEPGGPLLPLPKPGVDTGMGLERVLTLLQGVEANWETDLFRPIIQKLEEMSGRPYRRDPEGKPFRVIADHVRAAAFLVADGVFPSNEGRGYVLRRILRRAIRYGRQLGLEGPFLGELLPVVEAIMGDAYPELRKERETIALALRQEEERFGQTLQEGLRRLADVVEEARRKGGVIAGEDMFRLYDTYGFPLDLLQDAAREEGLALDLPGFEKAMEEQRRRAREDRQRKLRETRFAWPEDLPPTRFVGYRRLEAPFEILAVDGDEEGAWVILDQTPFYAEGGGQVGDQGVLRLEGREIRVLDTQRQGAWYLHRVAEKEGLQPGMEGVARVDEDRRRAAMRNHTATHLLHSALRKLLGPQTHQKGSLVAPDRLRFDFTALRPLTPEDLRAVEDEVNRWILEDLPVTVEEMDRDEALARGALAFFEEKYGERVRVVGVGSVSLELCGGTHVDRSSQIGLFHIVHEGGVGTGVRRIEAVTGWGLLHDLRRKEKILRLLEEKTKSPWDDLPRRLEQLEAEREALEAVLRSYEARIRRQERERLLKERDGDFVVAETSLQDPEELRTLAEELRQKLPGGGALLAATASGRVLLVAAFSPEAVERGLHAGKLLAEVAKEVGGGGGGRPDFAQAGGKDPRGLERALAKARELLKAHSPKP